MEKSQCGFKLGAFENNLRTLSSGHRKSGADRFGNYTLTLEGLFVNKLSFSFSAPPTSPPPHQSSHPPN